MNRRGSVLNSVSTVPARRDSLSMIRGTEYTHRPGVSSLTLLANVSPRLRAHGCKRGCENDVGASKDPSLGSTVLSAVFSLTIDPIEC